MVKYLSEKFRTSSTNQAPPLRLYLRPLILDSIATKKNKELPSS